jgi:protein tyrosine/serine phosphatase
MLDRHLDWDGCFNVRDLGGLPTIDGTNTRPGAAVRADSLNKLTDRGWAALVDHGVRTVIDLRNDFEREAEPDLAARPEAITTLELPLDGFEDREFWDAVARGPQFGTPIYYAAHLRRMPQRSAAVLHAIAAAPPGGVAFHCVGGRDRSGQVAILLLHLAGVPSDEIIADYELSDPNLTPLWRARGEPDQAVINAAFLADRDTTVAELINGLLTELDLEQTLRQGGLTDADQRALRARLLDQ